MIGENSFVDASGPAHFVPVDNAIVTGQPAMPDVWDALVACELEDWLEKSSTPQTPGFAVLADRDLPYEKMGGQDVGHVVVDIAESIPL